MNKTASSSSRLGPTMVSLFSGAGGLDLGLEMAGFRTLAASDFDANCISTLRNNKEARIKNAAFPSRYYFEDAEIIHADVANLAAASFGLPAKMELDLMIGGPPCQPFSSAGAQLGLQDPRGTLFEHYARLVAELQPKLILFENVRGLVTARGPSGRPGEALELVIKAFERSGYATRCALINSADFGVFQRRVRLFIIGSRIDLLPSFPSPTHSGGAQSTLFDTLLPWRTLGEFLQSQNNPDPDEIVRPSEALEMKLREIPTGSGLKSPGVKETTRPGGHWGYKQGTFIADTTKPARTITAASTQDWIRLDDNSLRRLTLAECSALQGFQIGRAHV